MCYLKECNEILFPNTLIFVPVGWLYCSCIQLLFCSLRFLLVISITFDFSSLNLVLSFSAQVAILSISTLAIFSASRILSARVINIKSSANATALV